MKITRQDLVQLIKEELDVLFEQGKTKGSYARKRIARMKRSRENLKDVAAGRDKDDPDAQAAIKAMKAQQGIKEQTPDEVAKQKLDSMSSDLDALMGEPKPKPKPVVKAKPKELPWDHPSRLKSSYSRREGASGGSTTTRRY
tara:strand:+ start:87 stop:512 length:426 start_codon:yes stop_codon:yes gene_type:complete